MGKTALITGATGMVGRQVLDLLLAREDVGRIISIGRRVLGLDEPRLREIVHQDFLDFSALEADLTGVDVCIHCLGVYQGQVTKQVFLEVTCDYQKALSDSLERASPTATFVLFGASGADRAEKSLALFARAKGRAENLLLATGFPRKYIFRPGYIHPTGTRRPAGLAYALFFWLMDPLLRMFPTLAVTDRRLARAMVTIALDGTRESGVIGNRELRSRRFMVD